MKLVMYQVDAFSAHLFRGNPAAVCVTEQWLSDDLMQAIAMENNLAETAFAVKQGNSFNIRWFTPELEVDLCGHATLATAHVLFEHLDYPGEEVVLISPRSGELRVKKSPGGLILDFPADELKEIPIPVKAEEVLGKQPQKALMGKTDYMLVYESEADILSLEPDFRSLARWGERGVIVTAPGDEVDFVSRFFAPQSGIDEDPVTGSAHTTLTPYWSKVLEKQTLRARQLSRRGGELICEEAGERVHISGKAITYLIGEIQHDA
jgi:PhzF family phenazine biosynthesis protein